MKEQEFNALLQNIENEILKENKLKIWADGSFGYGGTEENLSDQQVILLAEALKKNSYIKVVDLSGHNIGDNGAIALASINNLEELNLEENPITAYGATILAKGTFKKLSLATTLIIFYEERYNQFIEMINAFITNKTIIDLNLDCCEIPNEMIAQLIKNNTTIKILILGREIVDEAFKFIGENKTLEILWIPENKITDIGIEYITKNSSLKELSIANSKITDIGAKLLSTHPNLKELHIYDSNITSEGAKYFTSSNFNKLSINTNLKQDLISKEQCDYLNYTFKQAKALRDNLIFPTTSQQNQIVIDSDSDNQTLSQVNNYTNLSGENEQNYDN